MTTSNDLTKSHYKKLPAPIIENYEWRLLGACNGVDPEVFFLPYGVRTSTKEKLIQEAKKICATCPVITECRNFALETEEIYGVWGGLSEDERIDIIRKNRREKELMK